MDSPDSTTITRGRLALVAAVGLSSIIAAWYFNSTSKTTATSSNPPTRSGGKLHRSNAVRRSRARETTLLLPQDEADHDEAEVDADLLHDPEPGLPQNDAITIPETVIEEDDAYQDSQDEVTGLEGSQNMLHLLFNIGADNAKRQYYIHRGVACNACGTLPIQGIRYHCANCYDFDLCENCESQQIHNKTHIFYKIQIPAPVRGHIKTVAPVLYPGKPGLLEPSLPSLALSYLRKSTQSEVDEIQCLYDQFRCLASTEYSNDPLDLGVAIDRDGFDKYFTTPASPAASPSRLIYDRIFAYYDSNNDGLIGFEEFVDGVIGLDDKTRDKKLRRIFRGYDIDHDGYVDRKDFLRMFRAYYVLNKETTREIIMHQEEDLVDDDLVAFIEGSAPLSTAFTGGNLIGHDSRARRGKEEDNHGDLVIQDDRGVLRADRPQHGDRNEILITSAFHTAEETKQRREPDSTSLEGNLSNYTRFRRGYEEDVGGVFGSDVFLHADDWPPYHYDLTVQDIVTGLGAFVPPEDILDPVDRVRILTAADTRRKVEVNRETQEILDNTLTDRWKRREFYLDADEGMQPPPGYAEPDSSDDDEPLRSALKDTSPAPDASSLSRRPSLRSRSSSKVRFEDDVEDTDYETRSNTSSRSVPVGERWGGFELREAEKEVGKEVLYQAVQAGFNSVLDKLFKQKEDLVMDARRSRSDRNRWRERLDIFKGNVKPEIAERESQLREADRVRTEELLARASQADDPPGLHPVAFGGSLFGSSSTTNGVRIVDSHDLGQHSPTLTPADSIDVSSNATTAFAEGKGEGVSKPNGAISSSQSHAQIHEKEPSEEDLRIWSEHDSMDREVQARGGPGKLDFQEFEGRMARARLVVTKNDEEIKEDPEEGKDWRKDASLDMDFVGSWLDIYRF